MSHDRLSFRPTTCASPAALRLVDTFRQVLTHGGVRLAAFTVHGDDQTAHRFLSRTRFEEYGFLERLVSSAAFASSLPEFLPVDVGPNDFSDSSPLLFDGELAGALVWGGAYGRFEGSQDAAKRLGVDVSGELIGERYEDFRVDRSFVAWSDWFHAVAWDKTWVLTDKRFRRVTLLCITDVDGPM